MSKAFSSNNMSNLAEEQDDDEAAGLPALPVGTKNYITPQGYTALKSELLSLLDVERPEVVRIVSWAASNGDRSENGDYLYGKKRLREIDRRIRFLTKRLDLVEVVDPSLQENVDQVFFGAKVRYANQHGLTRTITIVGVDEVDPLHGKISWIAPVARALTKARLGDVVMLHTPGGLEELEILDIEYPT